MKKIIAELFQYAVIICVGIFVITIHVYAVADKSGTTSGEFLRIGVGARAIGMGEAYCAMADDVYSLYWNPAGLTRAKSRQVLLTHTVWYEDVNHEFAGYVHPLKNQWGNVGISAIYLGTTFEKRSGDTEAPDSKGDIADMAIGISWGRSLIWDLTGGLTAKYIQSKLDTYDASTYGIDLGLQRPFHNNKWFLSLAATNLFGALKYVSDSVALGQTIDLGFSIYDLYIKNVTFSADYRGLLNRSSDSCNVGVEYRWDINREWSLSPRMGFKSYDTHITYGVGFGYTAYQIDYAFVPHIDLGQSHRLSFSMKF